MYAVEFSHRSGRDLINVAKKRTNVIPIIEDARHPHKYRMLMGKHTVRTFKDVSIWCHWRIIYCLSRTMSPGRSRMSIGRRVSLDRRTMSLGRRTMFQGSGPMSICKRIFLDRKRTHVSRYMTHIPS